MNIIIITYKEDYSLELLVGSFGNLGINTKTIYYEDICLSYPSLSIDLDTIGKQYKLEKNDRLILRYPYMNNMDYSMIITDLVKRFPGNILFDKTVFDKFPQYEDKLFQSWLFNHLGIKIPKTSFNKFNFDNSDFPILVKKRISTRNMGNTKIKSRDELNSFLYDKCSSDFVYQEFLDFKKDLRLLFFRKKYLGAVERKRIIVDGVKKLKIANAYNVENSEIISDCEKIVDFLDVDLVGFDILLMDNRKYYFIEYNIMPQFISFTQKSGINVAEIIAKEVKEELNKI